MTVVEFYLSLNKNLYISSRYGWRLTPVPGYHRGTDIAGVGEGFPTPVPSASTIIISGYDPVGWGNYVRFQQIGSNYSILIAHLQERLVEAGQTVEAMTNIGGMGQTGFATGVHWHIEVWTNDGSRVNPETWPLHGRRVSPFQVISYGKRNVLRRRNK